MAEAERAPLRLTRRRFSAAAAGACFALGAGALAGEAAAPARTGMGLVAYCLGLRQRREKALSEPAAFLEACRTYGAGGMQVSLGIRDEDYTTALRRSADKDGVFIEAIIELSARAEDAERVEGQMRTAVRAGARVARVVVIPGRRYEQFASAEEFAAASSEGLRMLQLAEPLASKHKLRLAIENHKDQRVPERLGLLKRLGSEYVGMCVDLGNSFALCEDPMEVVRAFAPWAFSVHIKDQSVREYDEGFLYGDAALGEGFLDLAGMVSVVRRARPDVRFSLEVITRDPLRIPVFTDKYWATMGDVPAADLARTMRTVRAKASREPLPAISHLGPDEQVAAEAANVRRSIEYARDRLRI